MKTTIFQCVLVTLISVVFGIAAAHAEIKVGIAGPLSGSTLTLGEQQEVGAQKAFEHLNDKGGLLGQEIIVISVDDACETLQAKAVARCPDGGYEQQRSGLRQRLSAAVVKRQGTACLSQTAAYSMLLGCPDHSHLLKPQHHIL